MSSKVFRQSLATVVVQGYEQKCYGTSIPNKSRDSLSANGHAHISPIPNEGYAYPSNVVTGTHQAKATDQDGYKIRSIGGAHSCLSPTVETVVAVIVNRF